MDSVPDPILPEKFLWYSRESNPGPLGWQLDLLITIPNRLSNGPIALTKGKYNDHITMFSFIPPIYHGYYRGLKLNDEQ